MNNYEIYPLHVCTFLMKKSAGKYFPEVPVKIVQSPVLAYLIKANGKNIVIDTGACEADWSAKYHHELIYPDEMRIENRLKALGVNVDDVEIVVNTHLHWDHCYGNHLFKNAKFYVQSRELASAITPTPGQYLYYEAFQMGLTPPWLTSAGQFEVIDGDFELMPGIKLVLLPGHTPGMQGVLVETDSGKYLIASDLIPYYENWENRKYGLPIASDINTNLTEFYESLKKVLEITDYVLPAHDFRVLDKSVYK
jgi:N-acyl homoserine lactone hydrolase